MTLKSRPFIVKPRILVENDIKAPKGTILKLLNLAALLWSQPLLQTMWCAAQLLWSIFPLQMKHKPELNVDYLPFRNFFIEIPCKRSSKISQFVTEG